MPASAIHVYMASIKHLQSSNITERMFGISITTEDGMNSMCGTVDIKVPASDFKFAGGVRCKRVILHYVTACIISLHECIILIHKCIIRYTFVFSPYSFVLSPYTFVLSPYILYYLFTHQQNFHGLTRNLPRNVSEVAM